MASSLETEQILGEKTHSSPCKSRIENNLSLEIGDQACMLIKKYVDLNEKESHVLSTTTMFNIEKLEPENIQNIINVRRINDIRRVNKYFEAINEKLPINGIFIGSCETLELRKKRLLKKFPPVINRLYLGFDFIFKRVIPKLPITKNIYFALTAGRNRILSRAETLGRIYSCGFEVIEEKTIGFLYYYVVRKIKEPAFDHNASYGPLFKMVRTGKDGKIIRVYKMRTMYPFSEYLQQYVYERNKLETGGKFKDDFRVSSIGKIMRKFWIDELPMIINLFKGELKLVGVRPLSKQFQSLYPESFVKYRQKFRPGLVPPYYADMPQGLEEIIESEMRYLQACEKAPFITDWKYFWKAFTNIIFRKARSK